MYPILRYSTYLLRLSAVISILLLIAWWQWGLQLGLDFTGGAAWELRFADGQRPTSEAFGATTTQVGVSNPSLQSVGEDEFLLKAQDISPDQRQQLLTTYQSVGMTEVSFTQVGPTLGSELRHKAIQAVAFVLLAIIFYISYVFRAVSKGPVPSWMYGAGALIALAHDIILLVGAFVLLGHWHGVQVDALFVTALLTVLGFSVHDTIVVYDRVREGLKQYGKKSFETIINESMNITMARSLNTSLTALIVLTALALFGSPTVHWFIISLIIGIVTGTYSSIFIASPLLLVFAHIRSRRTNQQSSSDV